MRTLILFLICAGSWLFPAGFAWGTVKIQGMVTNQSNGQPVVGVRVKVLDANDSRINFGEVLSDVDGKYTFSLDNPGLYKVLVDLTVGSPLADQYYGGGIRHSGAGLVIISNDGDTATNIDIPLPPGFSIVGQITSGGVALDNVDLDVYHEFGETIRSVNASTTASGFYELGPFPDGTYIIRADPSASLDQPYLEKYYGGNTYFGSAAKIIIAGSSATGIDIDLDPAAIIKGIVSDNDGGPLDDIDFDVLDLSGSRLIYSGRSKADGKYAIGPLPTGSYIVKADPSKNSGYGRQLYPNSLTLNGAELIEVVDGQITEGINFVLPPAGTISGVVRDAITSNTLGWIDMDIFNLDGDKLVFSARGDVNGEYTFGPLPVGQYVVKCDPNMFSGYVEQYYSGQIARSESWPVTVFSNTDTSDIDFSLGQGGTIKGSVLDSGGSPLTGIDLDVYDSDGARLDYSTFTAPDGTYSIGPVLDGTYYVKADPDPALGNFTIPTFFGDVIDIESATPVTVAGGIATDININLDYGGVIGGTITDQDNNPIQGMDLDVFDDQGTLLPFSATTAIDGSYLLGAMPAGDYLVRADPPDHLRFISQYYDGVLDLESATAISVTTSLTTTGIDFNLVQGGSISGTIRDPDGNRLSNIDLDVYDSEGQFFNASAKSEFDGSFAVNGLPDGDYFLRADPDVASGQWYVGGYAGGAYSRADADPITLSGADVNGVVITLQPGGSVSGIVTGEGDQPLPGVDIDIFDSEGTLLPFDANTKSDGGYIIGPVLPGEYLLKADPPVESEYTTLYYDGQPLRSEASLVTVTVEENTSDIDFSLFKGGWISGTILADSGAPLDQVDLDLYSTDGNRLDATTRSGPDGTYLLGPVPEGDYIVRADPDDTTGYLVLYYPNRFNFDDAIPISVVAAQTTTTIDFSLPVAGWIEGIVTDASGTPLPDIDLDAFNANTLERIIQGDVTGEDGRYLIGPLPVQDILVRADPEKEQGYVREYYSEALSLRTANPVTVAGGVGVMNVDFTLEPGASISGTVFDSVIGGSVEGADIDIFRQSDLFLMDQNAKTRPDGTYSIGLLPEGIYIIKIDALNSTLFTDTYYGDTQDPALAIPVEISAGNDVMEINVSLPTFTEFRHWIESVDGNRFAVFEFRTQPGRTYTIEKSPTLLNGSWTSVIDILGDASLAFHSEQVPTGSERYFYRIRISN